MRPLSFIVLNHADLTLLLQLNRLLAKFSDKDFALSFFF